MSMLTSSTSPAAPPARRASGSTSSPATWPTPTPWPAPTARPTRRARSRSRPSCSARWPTTRPPPACASATISEDQTPGRKVHDPKHPAADADGYVTYSNVNAVEEMVNMISASRSYQNNIEVMNTAKTLLLKTLQLGQGG